MKNRNIYVLIGLVVFVFFIGMNIKKEITYSEYAKTKIENKIIDFGIAKLGDTVNLVFKIQNISDKHFVVSELRGNSDISFEGTILNKANFPGQEKFIYVHFVPENKGLILRKIEVVSNSTSGIFNLCIKGKVL